MAHTVVGKRFFNKDTVADFGGAVFYVDQDQSKYFSSPVRQLGAYGRRKFENFAKMNLLTRQVAKIFYE